MFWHIPGHMTTNSFTSTNGWRRSLISWTIPYDGIFFITENNKRRVEATEMDALRRSLRISRKEIIRNVTIRWQIGLEETIIKETEQNQLTWYGHVQRMVEGRLPKIALKWMPKQKRTRGRLKKNWMEGIRRAMNERNLNEGQWEDRKQLSLGVGQRRKTFWNGYIYIYGILIRKVSSQIFELFHPYKGTITLVNKDFVPLGKMPVSDVFLDA